MANEELIKSTSQNVIQLLEEEIKSRMPVSNADQVIMDSIPYSICWKDLDHTVVGRNIAFREFVGRDCIGQKLDKIFSEEEAEELEGVADRTVKQDKSEYFLIEMEDSSYEATESPIHENGKVVGTVLAITKKVKFTEKQRKDIMDSIDSLRTHVNKLKEKNSI